MRKILIITGILFCIIAKSQDVPLQTDKVIDFKNGFKFMGETITNLDGTGGISEIDSSTSVNANVVEDQSPDYFVTIKGNRFNKIAADSSSIGYVIPVYGAGTGNYTLTTSSQLINFDVTDPEITVDVAGTYILFANGVYQGSGVTATTQYCEFKIRRTNNTAADVGNTTVQIPIGAITTTGFGKQFVIPVCVYTTTNTDDNLELWGKISASLGAGSVTVNTCNLIALKIL